MYFENSINNLLQGQPKSFKSVIHKKVIKEVNGEPIENMDITEYNDNGVVKIEGQINNEPFLYTNEPKFRNKHVVFIDIQEPTKKSQILRSLTPYPRTLLEPNKMIHNNSKKTKRSSTLTRKRRKIKEIGKSMRKKRRHTQKNSDVKQSK